LVSSTTGCDKARRPRKWRPDGRQHGPVGSGQQDIAPLHSRLIAWKHAAAAIEHGFDGSRHAGPARTTDDAVLDAFEKCANGFNRHDPLGRLEASRGQRANQMAVDPFESGKPPDGGLCECFSAAHRPARRRPLDDDGFRGRHDRTRRHGIHLRAS
jgi:hypothetical protein